MSKAFQAVNNMAETIQSKVTVTDSHVHGDQSVLEAVLPKGLSIKQLETANQFSVDFAAASLIAASKVMADNQLETVTASFATPGGSIEHTINKEIEIAGEVKNGYAVTTFEFVTEGADNTLAYAQDLVANTDYGNGDLESE